MKLFSHKKIIIGSLVFVCAVLFFWVFINRFATRSRAAGQPVLVFFDKNTISTKTDTPDIPVNVFLQSGGGNKISAAKIQVSYMADVLEYDASKNTEIDPTCAANDNSLDQIISEDDNPTTGILTIAKGHFNSDNTSLPPHNVSGVFCLTTLHFKPKSGVTYPQKALVTLSTDPNQYDIVGPSNSYTAQISNTTNTVVITIDVGATLPSPTCRIGMSGYSLQDQTGCTDTASFHYISYSCYDNRSTVRIGSSSSCENGDVLKQKAQIACAGASSCVPISIVPTGPTSSSAHLSFNPTAITIPPAGSTFSVDVIIDAGPHQILGTDARMNFDPTKLDVVSIKDGSYFAIAAKQYVNSDTPLPLCPNPLPATYDLNGDGTVSSADYILAMKNGQYPTFISTLSNLSSNCGQSWMQPGSIYVAGIVTMPTDVKTGSGTLVTITFRAKAKGVSNVSYVCRQGETARDSNIIDNSQNIADVIDCSANSALTVNNTLDVTGSPLCPKFANGDCNCNNSIDIFDFELWRREFTKEYSTLKCDLNADGKVSLPDFNRWRIGYFGALK